MYVNKVNVFLDCIGKSIVSSLGKVAILLCFALFQLYAETIKISPGYHTFRGI